MPLILSIIFYIVPCTWKVLTGADFGNGAVRCGKCQSEGFQPSIQAMNCCLTIASALGQFWCQCVKAGIFKIGYLQ